MTASVSNDQAAAKLSVWQRFRHHILHPELTPERIAWSFALGFSNAWNPLLGTHTWVALACCFFLKNLHRPILLMATFLNNPWTMVPIASASVFFGNWLQGRGWAVDISGITWRSIGLGSFTSRQGLSDMYLMLKPVLVPYLLGGTILCILAVPLGYWFMLWLAKRLRKKHTNSCPQMQQVD
jgi:uncharacterized protein (DUF2062 family)